VVDRKSTLAPGRKRDVVNRLKSARGHIDGIIKMIEDDKILTYHVVPGKLDFAALRSTIQAGNGKAELKTVQGER